MRQRYEDDSDESVTDYGQGRSGQIPSNGHLLFGSLFAALTLTGFAFGVWAGASKPKAVEVAKESSQKPKAQPQAPAPQPAAPQPSPQPSPQPEPRAKEPEPKTREPEPEPKIKEPEPKPKAEGPEPKKIDVKPVAFKEVRPILMNYCGNCHGNAGKPKGGVDLRTVAAIMKGGDDGDLIKGGDPKKSPLYDSITAGRMPPDGKPAPSPKELQLIHDWIASGAKE